MPERWIEENHIVAPGLARQIVSGIGADDRNLVGAQRGAAALQLRHDGAILLHQHDALGLTGLVLTKLDGSAKGGVVLGIAAARPIALLFVGVGEGIDDLRPFVAADFVGALVD